MLYIGVEELPKEIKKLFQASSTYVEGFFCGFLIVKDRNSQSPSNIFKEQLRIYILWSLLFHPQKAGPI